MAEIDSYADVLAPAQRAAWSRAAEIADRVGGVLMGGTAAALHLRHRESEDLDIMTMRKFSGAAVAKRLARDFNAVEVTHAWENSCRGIADGVSIDVFKALQRSSVGPRGLRRVAKGPIVCGMPVGSLPDLLATKLEIIRFRPKLRDYIDLHAIDKLSNYTLEDGLGFYCHRFGHDALPADFAETIRLLSDAGALPSDPHFEHMRATVLGHLRGRAGELGQFAAQQHSLHWDPTPPAPSRRTIRPIESMRLSSATQRSRLVVCGQRLGPRRTCRRKLATRPCPDHPDSPGSLTIKRRR